MKFIPLILLLIIVIPIAIFIGLYIYEQTLMWGIYDKTDDKQ